MLLPLWLESTRNIITSMFLDRGVQKNITKVNHYSLLEVSTRRISQRIIT